MAKKKIKKTDPKQWRALEKTSETFRQIFITQKMKQGLNNYRAHGASTQVDFLADFELAIRKCYPEPKGRRAFWMWLFAPKKKVEDKEFKVGTEQFAVRVGGEIIKRHLVPSEYFRTVIRSSPRDKSAVRDDTLPKLESIVARYNRLRREYQLKHGTANPPDCYQETPAETETQDSGIGESQTNTDESTRFEEPVNSDALNGVSVEAVPEGTTDCASLDPFSRQSEDCGEYESI